MMIDTIREIGVARKIGAYSNGRNLRWLLTSGTLGGSMTVATGAEDIPASAKVLRRPRRT